VDAVSRLRQEAPDTAPPPRAHLEAASRRDLVEEVLVVLSLSLLASAVRAILSLLEAPVNPTVAVALFPSVQVARQFVDIVFDLAPVALVLHLGRRSGEGLRSFGLGTATLRADLAWGVGGGLAVAGGGLALYLGAIALGVNRFVVPVPPLGHWWTLPVLVLGSARNALLEEVVVVGYLIRRLGQVGWGPAAALAASAVLRASYHLSQGWGGFLGNGVMGLAFALAYLRWRRTWPLVVAHFLVDVLAGAGYIAFRGQCFWSLCIPG
jgi:membrane protease YdiL (CAAX protease family)